MEKSLSISLRLLICLSPFLPTTASATEPSNPLPSRELLEFLAEFSEVDDATYDLLEYHAESDLHKTNATPTRESNNE